MTDLISRQVALEAVGDVHPLDYNGQAILHRIQQLPSAEKHGRWIIKKDACGRNYTVCSNCNTSIEWRDRRGVLLRVDMQTANFCPNCGAKMERGEDGETKQISAEFAKLMREGEIRVRCR